jgi:hypothetical protein
MIRCAILSPLHKGYCFHSGEFREIIAPCRIQSNASEAGTYFFVNRCHRRRGFRHRDYSVCLLFPQADNNSGLTCSFNLPAADARDAAGISLCLSPHSTPAQTAGCLNGYYRLAVNHCSFRGRLDYDSTRRTASTATGLRAKRGPGHYPSKEISDQGSSTRSVGMNLARRFDAGKGQRGGRVAWRRLNPASGVATRRAQTLT